MKNVARFGYIEKLNRNKYRGLRMKISFNEISFNQADIDMNNDYIKKINKQIADLNRRKAKYQNKSKEIKKKG